jgi:predicted CopG family antitoxin
MATKTITLMDDAYERLKSLKGTEESFSDIIRRLTSEKGSILEFAGAWKNLSEKEAEALKRKLLETRKYSSRLEEIKRKMK